MKAGTKVIILMGVHKGKEGKILAKKRGSATIAAGMVNVEISGEPRILPEVILQEKKKN